MSGISSVASNSQNQQLQLWQLLAQEAAGSTSGSSSGTTADSLVASDSEASQLPASSTSGSGSLADLRQQLEAAVTTAVQNYDPSSGTSLQSTIKSAVHSTLQANGIDPQQLQAHLHGGHHHEHAAGGGDLLSQLSADSSESSSDQSASSQSSQSTSAATGSNPSSSTLDLSQIFASLFQNFPAGSGIDTHA